jgi:excisionase family DNA binding protein
MSATDRILTLVEAATLLRVSERTLWARVKKDELPYFRVGKQYRFVEADLIAWARSEAGGQHAG